MVMVRIKISPEDYSRSILFLYSAARLLGGKVGQSQAPAHLTHALFMGREITLFFHKGDEGDFLYVNDNGAALNAEIVAALRKEFPADGGWVIQEHAWVNGKKEWMPR